ncbi:MAG: hypothetical protein IJP44_09350 [Bacteroidales bacterium]|nr:hypothetical protein [Bacteroidales bacterium]
MKDDEEVGEGAKFYDDSFIENHRRLTEAVHRHNCKIILQAAKINEILNNTAIQYVSLSRPFIREPNLISRWRGGDTTPSKCISCNGCYRTMGHRCVFRR